MAWRTTNVREQRVEFVVAASRKQNSMSQLCAEFGISRPTGYHWLQRYRTSGIGGVQEKSRRPQHSPGRTATRLEERVVELRRGGAGWGGRKIQLLLRQEGIPLARNALHPAFPRHGF